MRDRISAALKEAMRAKDQTRIATLRLIMAAIKDREIAVRAEDGSDKVDEAEIVEILGKMLKQRRDSVRFYEEAGRLDAVEREQAEMKIIREFLPKPLSEDEMTRAIRETIKQTGAESIRDMGKVMGALKEKYAGRMDFAQAGAAVRRILR